MFVSNCLIYSSQKMFKVTVKTKVIVFKLVTLKFLGEKRGGHEFRVKIVTLLSSKFNTPSSGGRTSLTKYGCRKNF